VGARPHVAKIVGFIVGLVVFSVWMNIVGNPHVVETVLGVGISIFAGAWVWRWLVRR
ncbi:uncharacterized protein METZ01_LOCUS428590, partial [marine metagenome]